MIAVAAIDRAAGARFERYLSLFSAFCAGYSVALAIGLRCGNGVKSFLVVSGLSRFAGSPGSSASRTALGRVIQSFGMESILFFHIKSIRLLTIVANECDIFKLQLDALLPGQIGSR
jgi:hypothetical protein